MRVLALPAIAVLVLLVGLGIMPASIGDLGILCLLVASGLAWRLVKLVTGMLLLLFSFL